MADVKPFCGLRPAPEQVAKVASLPYDVLDREEARQITAANPCSFLRVTRAEVDLAADIDPHSPPVYAQAAKNLNLFLRQGLLAADPTPCFYIYQQQMNDHCQIGLVAAASLDEYETGQIKKHELTRPDKEQDRVDHLIATQSQTGAVFLTYRADPALTALIDRARQRRPVYDFTAADGISHTLYVIDEPALITGIERAFRNIAPLYIADGHHRSAAAARVRNLWRAANSAHTGSEEYNRFLAVIFPDTMMKIMAYNRVVTDLNGRSATDFLAAVQKNFVLTASPAGPAKPRQAHTFGLYLNGTWHYLTAKPGTFPVADPVASLDVSILQTNLLEPLLGIGNPRTDRRIGFVGGIRGLKELERLVDEGRYAVAVALFPTAISELMTIADAGQLMPPKSTWFEPKLRDAMVIHQTPAPGQAG